MSIAMQINTRHPTNSHMKNNSTSDVANWPNLISGKPLKQKTSSTTHSPKKTSLRLSMGKKYAHLSPRQYITTGVEPWLVIYFTSVKKSPSKHSMKYLGTQSDPPQPHFHPRSRIG
jgi:hypothetical protein